jgi:hypothetical protein
MTASLGSIDFEQFHRHDLPGLLAAGNDRLAAAARGRGSLAFRVDGRAYTYRRASDAVEIVSGDEAADVVIELSRDDWAGVVQETMTAPGLLYGGKVKCLRGDAIEFVSWEPALRAMYNGRPVWNPNEELLDHSGDPLDPARGFRLDDDRVAMAHFLRTAGFLVVRSVFDAGEVQGFLEEAAVLETEAVKGDQLSWWGKNADAEEVLCRVNRAAAKPRLASIPRDARLLGLVDLADDTLVPRVRADREEEVSLIFKRPVMAEGLSDLPWHRDCGMGGHAQVCPVLIASVFLTDASRESGDLRMLPGSWKGSAPYIDANDSRAPGGTAITAAPGDVSLHYGDTMHAAPPPESSNRARYRISAVTGYALPNLEALKEKGGYNHVLHGRADGQIEHLSKVAERVGSDTTTDEERKNDRSRHPHQSTINSMSEASPGTPTRRGKP